MRVGGEDGEKGGVCGGRRRRPHTVLLTPLATGIGDNCRTVRAMRRTTPIDGRGPERNERFVGFRRCRVQEIKRGRTPSSCTTCTSDTELSSRPLPVGKFQVG